MCTVTCHQCTADAPVDTLTDGTLIRTVTKTRVTLIRASANTRNPWHKSKGVRVIQKYICFFSSGPPKEDLCGTSCAALIHALVTHICHLYGPLGRIHFTPLLRCDTAAYHVQPLSPISRFISQVILVFTPSSSLVLANVFHFWGGRWLLVLVVGLTTFHCNLQSCLCQLALLHCCPPSACQFPPLSSR